MESLSWKRYDAQHKLSDALTLAARSCVDVRAARPVEYLAAYFTKMCTGDEIRSILTYTLYLPGGTHALQFSLHLLNGMEAESTALLQPCHGEGSSTADENTDSTTAVADLIRQNYIPQLLKCGACDQKRFDEILHHVHASAENSACVGLSVVHALSVAAASAAARCSSLPLFQYLRKSIAPSDDVESFAMPQLCISFFGPENLSSARVAVRDVFLIPAMPEGVINRGIIQKIFAAFRHFSRVHGAATRGDGSLAFDGFESLAEAVSLAEEAVRAVGLTPVEDVCVGLRLAAAVVPASGKDNKEPSDVMYALFPGDVDVSGSQVAEYVREQLQQRTDFVVYVEDTHCDRDAAGLRRLQSRMGAALTVSGRELYLHSGYGRVEQGLSELWTSNVVVEPSGAGTLSDVYDIARRVWQHEGRCVSFATHDLGGNAAFVAHLAVGAGGKYICTGGLLGTAQCDVLSHLMSIQDDLEHTRMLCHEAPKLPKMELPEAPTDAVPEIKRRLEKKKRKK
ncbi:enolase [Trypanosoma grayi]|uniref:enolase n=1 Tax=Trypanosoma grayi TaxID=71804 RepID=UPI0004F41AB9|nr:enolase [Trypanosoma grayi]KEG15590.1 enolase [Trypanosoma grayi]